MSALFASEAKEWYFAEFALHDPAKVDWHAAVDQNDVVGTLMVGHNDVGLTFDDILFAHNLYGHGGKPLDDLGPCATSPTGSSGRDEGEHPS